MRGRERDGLYGNLFDAKCRVLWLCVTDDAVYSGSVVDQEINVYINLKDAKLCVIDRGHTF